MYTGWEKSLDNPNRLTGKDPITLIKHKEQILFVEPTSYECYERFIEVAEIIKARYGKAVLDFVFTRESELYLLGDRIGAPQLIYNARQKIFGSHAGAEMHQSYKDAHRDHPSWH